MLFMRDPAGHVIYEGPCWSCYIGGTMLGVMLYRRDPDGHVI